MIKVKILKDGVRGADDGATVLSYPKDGGPNGDGVYVVSDALGEVLIEANEAEEVEEKKPTATDRVSAKKAAAEKAAAEKAEADRLAAEKAEADRIAAEKAAADKVSGNGLPGLPGLPKAPGK